MDDVTRKLGSVEHLFATLHSMGAMLYVNVAKVQGVLSPDILRSALGLIQRRHPLLRAHIQESKDGLYFSVNGTLEIPLMVVDRQHEEQWIAIAESELQLRFTGEFAPLCRVTLLRATEKQHASELIITFHHAIADGISALHFLDDLLSYYEEVSGGSSSATMDALPLLPPLEELLEGGISETSAAAQADPSPHMIIENTAPAGDRRTRLITRELDQVSALKLRDRCRDERTTVHGALCAAMVRASARRLSPTEAVVVSCSSSVNLRKSCLGVGETGQLGFFNANVTTTHCPGLDGDFWELARECQSTVRQLIHAKVPHDQVFKMRDKHPSSSSFAKLAEHNMGRMTTVHVSNLGQFAFKKTYGSLRLESFHFAVGLSLVGTCFWLGATTVDEKLFCTLTYTDPLISAKTATSLTDSVMTILAGAVD